MGACQVITGAEAVGLGGSRARGDHRADSDWDFAVYYRGILALGQEPLDLSDGFADVTETRATRTEWAAGILDERG